MITEKLQVLTPTKEDFKKVVQCMLDNGNVWRSGDTNVCEEYWDSCKENTTVEIGRFENEKRPQWEIQKSKDKQGLTI